MAVINKTNSYMEFPLQINRQYAAPLDKTSVFYSFEEAQTYAQSNPIAYVGQIVQVVDESNSNATAYIIKDTTGNLEEIGSGGSLTIVVSTVADLTSTVADDLKVGQTAYVTENQTSYILAALGDNPPTSYEWEEMASNDTTWAGTENPVTFYAMTQSQFDGTSPKDSNTLYFLTDTGKIYKGDVALTDSVIVTNSIPEVSAAVKNKLYINSTTLEAKITANGSAYVNLSPGYLTDGANWAEADGNKLATIALIKKGITSSLNALLGAGTADVVITATAEGGIQRTTKTLGGATLQGEPTENVLATEVAVKTAIDNAISWTDIPSV